jgi:hypothetical protein
MHVDVVSQNHAYRGGGGTGSNSAPSSADVAAPACGLREGCLTGWIKGGPAAGKAEQAATQCDVSVIAPDAGSLPISQSEECDMGSEASYASALAIIFSGINATASSERMQMAICQGPVWPVRFSLMDEAQLGVTDRHPRVRR